jgi:hypothetical protein
MKKALLFVCLFATHVFYVGGVSAATEVVPRLTSHPVDSLVGEELVYDISFLWFDRLALGTIRLSRGEAPGTYLAVLEAQTRGFSAFVTKNRRERFQTLMEIGPDGLLRPLLHSSHSLKGKGDEQREKITSYSFDYATRQVKFQKVKDHIIHADELLPFGTDGPIFDILSAFYNLRCGSLGSLDGTRIKLPTFHRKGIEEIVIAPVADRFKGNGFFAKNSILRKILVSPEIFKTNGRDLLISFDETGRPLKAVIKNVIGLGDVKGVLRHSIDVYPGTRHPARGTPLSGGIITKNRHY